MNHWLNSVAELVRAETPDLRELAKLVGADARTFYVGTRLDGVDIRGQDLRGMKFTALGSAALTYDGSTRLDAKYASELNANPNATFVLRHELLGSEPAPATRAKASETLRATLSERSVIAQTVKLLATFLENRDVGVLMIENYPPGHGATIEHAIYLLKQQLREGNEGHVHNTRLIVAQTVDVLLRTAYIYNRPHLLIAMTRTLGKVPIVREVLLDKVRRSRSSWIESQRQELFAYLNMSGEI